MVEETVQTERAKRIRRTRGAIVVAFLVLLAAPQGATSAIGNRRVTAQAKAASRRLETVLKATPVTELNRYLMPGQGGHALVDDHPELAGLAVVEIAAVPDGVGVAIEVTSWGRHRCIVGIKTGDKEPNIASHSRQSCSV